MNCVVLSLVHLLEEKKTEKLFVVNYQLIKWWNNWFNFRADGGLAPTDGNDDGIVGGPRTPQQIAAQKRLQQTQAQVDEVGYLFFVDSLLTHRLIYLYVSYWITLQHNISFRLLISWKQM